MNTRAETLVDTGDIAAAANGEIFSHVTGRVAPYSVFADVGWMLESFDRGAFTASLVNTPNLPLLLWHDNRSLATIVGLADAWDDRPDGLHGRFRLNYTASAQEAGRLARDGYLSGLSVGFQPVRSTWQYVADDQWNPDAGWEHMDRVTRHEARLLEVSLVSTPAYEDARVTDVESEQLAAFAQSDLRRVQLWRRNIDRSRAARLIHAR